MSPFSPNLDSGSSIADIPSGGATGIELGVTILLNQEALLKLLTAEVGTVWVKLQCMECKCQKEGRHRLLLWHDTKSDWVECPLWRTRWGRQRADQGGRLAVSDADLGGTIIPAELWESQVESILEDCSSLGSQLAETQCN